MTALQPTLCHCDAARCGLACELMNGEDFFCVMLYCLCFVSVTTRKVHRLWLVKLVQVRVKINDGKCPSLSCLYQKPFISQSYNSQSIWDVCVCVPLLFTEVSSEEWVAKGPQTLKYRVSMSKPCGTSTSFHINLPHTYIHPPANYHTFSSGIYSTPRVTLYLQSFKGCKWRLQPAETLRVSWG